MKNVSSVVVLACGMFLGGRSSSAAYLFDASLLGDSARNVDISLLEQGGQLPGIYPVDVIVNGERVDSREMVFHTEKDFDGNPVLRTCLTRNQLVRYGVKVEDYPGLFPVSLVPGNENKNAELNTGAGDVENSQMQCARLSAIPQATEVFQFSSQQLLLNVPQVAMRPHHAGIAPRESWSDGIPAFLMNYQVAASRFESRSAGGKLSSDNVNVQLEPGFNLGAWRVRNLTSWQKLGREKGIWQSSYIYAERGLYSAHSRLVLGERFTPSDVFDSVPFSGVQLGTDDAMVSFSEREFAPIVHGIARTQARIEVRQNGYVVYNATVAPGPFELRDITTSGSGGELNVTVFEADGTRQVFNVPYTLPAIALRQGYLRYNLMGGKYRPAKSGVDNSPVGQATVMYGLPWDLTVYGGVQGARHYVAGALGLGVSLGRWGAASLDGVQSREQKQFGNVEKGQAWRLRYSKLYEPSQTAISVVSYRYASSGYSTMSEVLDTWDKRGELCSLSRRRLGGGDVRPSRYCSRAEYKRKTRTDLTLSQSLGAWGSLYFSGSRESYWNRAQHVDEFSAGYSFPTIKDISLSVNWGYRQRAGFFSHGESHRQTEQTVGLWVNVPLNRWLGGGTSASWLMNNSSDRGTQHSFGLSGQAFDQQLSWDVHENMVSGVGDSDSSNVSLRWLGTYGEISGGYGYRRDSRQMNVGVQGGVVVHPNGVTLSQKLGDTVALIEAPGVSGVSVGGNVGVRTDFRGYAVQGYLSPYQENTVTLNPATLPPDAEILQTDMRVVPTKGAVIPVKYVSHVGGRAIVSLMRPDGQVVPFGAVARVDGNKTGDVGIAMGIVGDSGEVYMTGLPESGHIMVRWGNSARQQCRGDYHLPEHSNTSGVYSLKMVCK